jgi:hypothetical protein
VFLFNTGLFYDSNTDEVTLLRLHNDSNNNLTVLEVITTFPVNVFQNILIQRRNALDMEAGSMLGNDTIPKQDVLDIISKQAWH